MPGNGTTVAGVIRRRLAWHQVQSYGYGWVTVKSQGENPFPPATAVTLRRTRSSIDNRWKGLRNALSGLFCASLGSLDEQRTTSPLYAFRPEGSLPKFSRKHHLRHASLPSEHVCTENLTPFLKLLPCKSTSGLASLLNPHKLFDADWHGMSVHVFWDKTAGVTVRLSFQAVLDPVRSSISNKRGLRPIDLSHA